MPPSLLPSGKPLNIPQTLAQALEMHRQGRLADAEQLYTAILAVRPDHFDALHMLGVLKLAHGQLGEALHLIAGAMRSKTPTPEILMNYGIVLNALNRHHEALESFDLAIKKKSKFSEAHINRSTVLAVLGRNEEALDSCRKALGIAPNNPQAHYSLGNLLQRLDRNEEALKSYDRTLALRPNYSEAFYNRGITLRELKRFDEALASYDRALALRPNYAEALSNRGNILRELARFDEALASYDDALAVLPTLVEALYSRANTLRELKRFDEALASLDRVLSVRPDHFDALYNRGNALQELKRFDEALASYDRALSVRPNDADALNHRGAALQELNRLDEALASYDRALAMRPDDADALNNRGSALQELNRLDEALASYNRALAIKADHEHAFSGAAGCAIKLCDWDTRTRFGAEINAHVSGKKSIISPFVLFGYSGDPALQLQCARNHIENKLPSLPQPFWAGQTWHHNKLRVAYLSADFHSHATAHLMAEMFEKHDRSRFEITGVSFGVDDRSEMRKRLIAAFDHFYDVRTKTDREVAQSLYKLQIDIAIDLKGYTQHERFGILSYRPAPIQVSYLGYPGTMATQAIDYIIADKVVAPFEHQQFYSERIVNLPDSYQVNDTRRKIAKSTLTRQEAALPEHEFVFCSFNNNWKITPEIFDVWMRLLHHVEGSVLWLLRDNDGAERNLRKEAQRRGIDPSRIVFAERLPTDQHLARHRLADLFLDTLPCNAHTTASDALWAELPVLTCRGDAFAGRVAASLLHGVGIPELITSNLAEYQALALKLAHDPALLAEIKAKLAHNRNTYPLFNTERFARHIEAAYTTMWETWQRGEEPKSFSVEPID